MARSSGSRLDVQRPVSARRRPHEPRTIVLVIGGPITRADIPKLCERIRALVKQSNVGLIVCDVGALLDPDAVTVDALARLQLTAQRYGRQLRVRDASGQLRDLFALIGLSDVVRLDPLLRIEPRRQPKEREQGRGVQEEGDSTDSIS